jgi:hypothetical protein
VAADVPAVEAIPEETVERTPVTQETVEDVGDK